MDSSAKRKVGAIALIVAGIGAFLVPFLLHGPALQASSNGGGSTACTSNCNPSTTKTPSCTSDCSPGTNPSPGSNPAACSTDDNTDPSGHTNEGLHLAKGHDKDTFLVGRAQGFMAALGKHNPQHDATHSTKTDNDTIDAHGPHSNGHDTDDTGACADSNDNDDQGNDD